MAMDAVCLQAVLSELRPKLLGLRIDKIQQPARDQVIVLLRGNLRLLLSIAAGAPRIQFTAALRDNPAEPPMFCMLLRKHLVGGRITAVTQPEMERLVRLDVDITDDFGRPGQRSLVLEAMGRNSNVILLDGEGRIIDSLRRVDADMTRQRQILPGLFYELPSRSDKPPLTALTEEIFQAQWALANPERQLDAFLLDSCFGVSPLIARELVFRATGETDTRIQQVPQPQLFWREIARLIETVKEERFTPIALKQGEKPLEFSYLPIAQYGDGVEMERWDDFSALLDGFYTVREQQDRIHQRGADLVRTATTVRDRLRRKLSMQERDYAATQNRDTLRIFGDLITANLYRMERAAASFTTENFYDEAGGTISIPLDPLLTPQQNAAKYYKRYNKAKTAERVLGEQMALARQELEYLESVLGEIQQAESEQDFIEIRNELKDAGYIRRLAKDKKELKRPNQPRIFRTTGGFRVLVGRNNRQNDKLTCKDADHRDIWFHTQKIHGSHVILCTEGRHPAPDDLTQAAQIAAYYSQARSSGNVPVDYTAVKNVKKPAGARPGMVIYPTYQTLFVTPEAEAVKALQAK
ncbi:MAG: NFACT RNA binding domain-containing protein [Oscillibacter sp.]